MGDASMRREGAAQERQGAAEDRAAQARGHGTGASGTRLPKPARSASTPRVSAGSGRQGPPRPFRPIPSLSLAGSDGNRTPPHRSCPRRRSRMARRPRTMGTDVARLESALEHERSAAAEKVAVLIEAREELSTQLRSMCAEALRGNNEQFIELAKAQFAQLQLGAKHDLDSRQKAVENLVGPIKESLERVGGEVKTLEKARRQDVGLLTAQLKTVADTNERLRVETGSLVTALRAPSVHGRWGEMQLKNTVESAGMLAYCDFVAQLTGHGERGSDPAPGSGGPVARRPNGRGRREDSDPGAPRCRQTNDEAVRCAAPCRLRPQRPRSHGRAEGQVLLEAVRIRARLRRHVPARRKLLPSGASSKIRSLLEQHASSGIVLRAPPTLITHAADDRSRVGERNRLRKAPGL